MTFAQLHYFLSQNIGGGQNIICPPCSIVGGDMFPRPPINSVPVCNEQTFKIFLSQNKFIEAWQRQTPPIFNWFTDIFRVKNA